MRFEGIFVACQVSLRVGPFSIRRRPSMLHLVGFGGIVNGAGAYPRISTPVVGKGPLLGGQAGHNCDCNGP